MKWCKKGIVFDPSCLTWAKDSALQPTPLVLEDRVRVFFGARDITGVSRVGYVDFSHEDMTTPIQWSVEPVLDIGEDGCFDESGVVPSAVVMKDGVLHLFYAGYQLGKKVRFIVLGGLAVSSDEGRTFSRVKNTPVFERTHEETLFRVPHSVFVQDGVWKAWYGGGNRFVQGKDKTLPLYDIRYIESDNPNSFSGVGNVLLETSGDEYRLGRPFLYKKADNDFYMFYGFSTESDPYKLGCARSSDLKTWVRIDNELGLPLSESGWDSEMMAYPGVVSVKGKTYMFYNGNSYGKSGFGLAELIEW